MTTPRTVADKYADWKTAFDAIRADLTPSEVRLLVSQVTAADPAAVHLGIDMARIAAANDRASAIAAAMITQSGVSRPTVEID